MISPRLALAWTFLMSSSLKPYSRLAISGDVSFRKITLDGNPGSYSRGST